MQGDRVVDEEAARMLVDLMGALSPFLDFNGRWDDEIHLNARAYEAARALHDWSEAGWRAYRVAWVHYNRTRTDDAALWTDQCAEAWNRIGDKSGQATVLRQRGMIAEQRQDDDEAKRFYLDAIAIWRSLNEDLDVAHTLLDLGDISRGRNDDDAAAQYYHEALEIYQKHNTKQYMPPAFEKLGFLALKRRQWSEAREWYQEALTLSREIGRVESLAFAQMGLAKVWEAEGRVDLALLLARESLATFEQLQHGDLEWARKSVESITAASQKSMHSN